MTAAAAATASGANLIGGISNSMASGSGNSNFLLTNNGLSGSTSNNIGDGLIAGNSNTNSSHSNYNNIMNNGNNSSATLGKVNVKDSLVNMANGKESSSKSINIKKESVE